MVSLASVSDAVNVWKYESSRLELTSSFTSSTGACNCIAWNHTNQVVATGGDNHQIHLIQANNGNILSSLQVAPDGSSDVTTNAIALSSNSRFLAAGLTNTVQVWDLKRRQIKTLLTDHNDTVSALSFLQSGEIVSGDKGGVVRIWESKTYSPQAELFASSGTLSVARVTSLSVPPSGGSALAVGYDEGTLRVWDTTSGSLLRTQLCHDGSLTSLAYSPRNPRLVSTAGADGRVTLIDTGSKNTTGPSAVIDLQGMGATAVSFHEDAIHTAVGLSNGRIVIYDWRSLRKPVVSTAPREQWPILSLAFQVCVLLALSNLHFDAVEWL
jgi:WD40 repeat protein